MDIQRIMNIVNQVKNIPFLQDEKIKSGDFSNLNEMSILHYVVFPFLNALGYEIYNPNEVKVEGMDKVELYASGVNILSFRINLNTLDLNENPSKNLLVDTNGIRYIVYGDNEKILDFDIRHLDKENLNLIFGLLLKENIFKGVGNSKFISEKILEMNTGNLKESKYFNVALRDLLSNPSNKFIESLGERLFELYCENVNKDEFNNKILDEFSEFNFLDFLGSVEDNLEVAISNEVIENKDIYDSYLTLPGDNVEVKTEEAKTEEIKADEVKTDESKVEEIKLEEAKIEEDKAENILDEEDDLSYLLNND